MANHYPQYKYPSKSNRVGSKLATLRRRRNTPRTILAWQATLVVGWVMLAMPVASRADLLDQFRTEYPAAAVQLDAAYSHVRIRTIESQWDQQGSFIWTYHCEYLREGDLVRKVQTIIKSNYSKMPDKSVRALGGSSEKFFTIRKQPGQQFIFTDFGPKAQDDFSFVAATECIPLFASCYGDATNIREYVTRSDVRLVSAQPMSLGGTPVVDVLTDQTLSDGHVLTHLYFLPKSWAFAGWTLNVEPIQRPSDPHHIMELRIAYDNQHPIQLKSIDKWISATWDPSHKSERSITVESTEFTSIPVDKFTVADLGVQEPALTRPDPTAKRSSWMVIFNIALLSLLGIAFYFLSRWRRATAASSEGNHPGP